MAIFTPFLPQSSPNSSLATSCDHLLRDSSNHCYYACCESPAQIQNPWPSAGHSQQAFYLSLPSKLPCLSRRRSLDWSSLKALGAGCHLCRQIFWRQGYHLQCSRPVSWSSLLAVFTRFDRVVQAIKDWPLFVASWFPVVFAKSRPR